MAETLNHFIKGELIMEKQGTIIKHRNNRETPVTGTLTELIEYFKYTLETGKSYEHEKGNKKINMAPKSISALVDNLNKAQNNAAANGYNNTYYSM